jgi:hypothetical protein
MWRDQVNARDVALHTGGGLAVALVEADLRRYSSTADLRRWNEQAGFGQLAEVVVEFPYSITDISVYRDKAYSCLHLIQPDAHRRGVELMERDLTKGPLQVNARYFLLWATKESHNSRVRFEILGPCSS